MEVVRRRPCSKHLRNLGIYGSLFISDELVRSDSGLLITSINGFRTKKSVPIGYPVFWVQPMTQRSLSCERYIPPRKVPYTHSLSSSDLILKGYRLDARNVFLLCDYTGTGGAKWGTIRVDVGIIWQSDSSFSYFRWKKAMATSNHKGLRHPTGSADWNVTNKNEGEKSSENRQFSFFTNICVPPRSFLIQTFPFLSFFFLLFLLSLLGNWIRTRARLPFQPLPRSSPTWPNEINM